MPKFRKKPIVVEAGQFRGFYATPYPAGVEIEDHSNDPEPVERYQFYVVTAYGKKTYVTAGDWVINDPGYDYPYICGSEIFAATYEPFEG